MNFSITKLKQHLVTILSTGFYVGFLPHAPGTWGTIVGLPFAFMIAHLMFYIAAIVLLPWITGMGYVGVAVICSVYFLIMAMLYHLGVILARNYIKELDDKDPGSFVYDEIYGIILAYLLIIPSFIYTNVVDWYVWIPVIAIFILFRIFDIVKPWPIRTIEKKLKGPNGVMLDDVVAAILAALVYHALAFLWIS